MSADPRPYFARPWEYYLASGTDFEVDSTPVTDFPQGAYANVLSLAHSFAAYVDINFSGSGTFEFRMNDDGYLEFMAGGIGRTIEWADGNFGHLLGYHTALVNFTADTWITADTLPRYTWFPSYQIADQGWWATKSSEVAIGATSQNGTFAGVQRGETVYHRVMRFNQMLATNVMYSKTPLNSSYEMAYWTAEWFFNGSLTAAPQSDECPSIQGFWVYPDINDAIADCTLSTDEPWNETTDIGVRFDMWNPDIKVFCHTEPGLLPPWDNQPGLPATTLRYNFDIGMHTAPRPSWTYYDYNPGC